VSVTVAERNPAASGRKVTAIVQFVLTAMAELQPSRRGEYESGLELSSSGNREQEKEKRT
jgi:hypothetical protein